MIEKIFESKVDKIIYDEKSIAILLVGSAADTEKSEYDKLRDIDIFVITEKDNFYREVIDNTGVEFDISYLPISLLKKAIDDRISSLINVLYNSKVIYSSNTIIYNYLGDIEKVYLEGPKHLEENKIRYIRFRLCKMHETIINRKKEDSNAAFLLNDFIKELIYSYFKLNRIWTPSDKKILQTIKKIDNSLYSLIVDYYKSYNIDDMLKIASEILDHVIKPFGGALVQWEKAEYPFDFT